MTLRVRQKLQPLRRIEGCEAKRIEDLLVNRVELAAREPLTSRGAHAGAERTREAKQRGDWRLVIALVDARPEGIRADGIAADFDGRFGEVERSGRVIDARGATLEGGGPRFMR